jgi:hypothetical protein
MSTAMHSAIDMSPPISSPSTLDALDFPLEEGSGLLAALPAEVAADEEGDIVCRVKKYEWKPPAGFENHVYRQHQGEGSQYLRDFILGVNDGIISTFLVIVGLVAGGASVKTGKRGGAMTQQ